MVEKGDLFLNSGDLMKIDEDGFVFFQDRVGDPFRCARVWMSHAMDAVVNY